MHESNESARAGSALQGLSMHRTESVKRHFVASAILFHDKEVLLLEHKKLGSWLGPGGHVEANETPDEAVRREILEETGLTVTVVDTRDNSLGDDKAEVLHNPFAILCELINIPSDIHYHIDMIYLCKTDSRNFNRDNREYDNAGWFTQQQLDELYLFPNYRVLLDKAFKHMNEQDKCE